VKARHERILRSLLSVPTAAFAEQAVVDAVADWAGRRGVALTRDRAGNVLLRHRRGRSKRRWVFAAHMDHPGFCALSQRGRSVHAEFRGGVARRYFVGSAVRFFAADGEVTGRVRTVRMCKATQWHRCRIDLDCDAIVPVGALGMWDLAAMRIRGRRLISRACDDVVGSAGVVCALDEIIARKIAADVTILLTRGEEAAFIGAMAAAREPSIPGDALLVAIETSRAVPGARLGDGVVVRVGDAARIYDPSLTGFVSDVARSLAKRDRAFAHVRQLMPGGVCESTAYAMFGYTATGLCLPLANYHNMGPRDRIAPEQVDTGDFDSLVKLLVAIAADRGGPEASDRRLKQHLDARFKARAKYLR